MNTETEPQTAGSDAQVPSAVQQPSFWGEVVKTIEQAIKAVEQLEDSDNKQAFVRRLNALCERAYELGN